MQALPLAAAVVAAFTAAAFGLSLLRTGRRRRMPSADRSPRRDNNTHAVRVQADAEMEEHDIDDMLDAIAARRRARGRRDLGDELLGELLDEDVDG